MKGFHKAITAFALSLFAIAGVLPTRKTSDVTANAGIMEDYYLQDCVDICDSSWVGGNAGNQYGWRQLSADSEYLSEDRISVQLDGYTYHTCADSVLYWYGGNEGGLYNQEDVFAIEFAANVSDDGFAFRIDQFSIWINASYISIGYNDQWTSDDWHRTYWFGDIGMKGCWLTQKNVELSGIEKIRIYVYTEANETMFVVEAGGYCATATTMRKRIRFDSCGIISGFEDTTIFTVEVAELYTQAEEIMAWQSYNVLSKAQKDLIANDLNGAIEFLYQSSLTKEDLETFKQKVDGYLDDSFLNTAKENAIGLLNTIFPSMDTAEYTAAKQSLENCESVFDLEVAYSNITRKPQVDSSPSSDEKDSSTSIIEENPSSTVTEEKGCSSIVNVGMYWILFVGGAILLKKKRALR